MIREADSIYHEKQSWELCALHALNNLFQGVAFTKRGLDEICQRLAPEAGWMNPHRSALGLGNYDVNVLMAALQEHDCVAVWFDKRRECSSIELSSVVGFIINVPSPPKLGLFPVPFTSKRHWIAVRLIAGGYWNLDSKLKEPQLIGGETELVAFLDATRRVATKEIIMVVPSDIAERKSYYRGDVVLS